MRYCMALHLKDYQNYDKSKLKIQVLLSKSRCFQLEPVVFLIPLEVQGNAVPHLKALRYGK